MFTSIYAHPWRIEDLEFKVTDSQSECSLTIEDVTLFLSLEQAERLQRTLEHYLVDRAHREAIEMNNSIDMLTTSPGV